MGDLCSDKGGVSWFPRSCVIEFQMSVGPEWAFAVSEVRAPTGGPGQPSPHFQSFPERSRFILPQSEGPELWHPIDSSYWGDLTAINSQLRTRRPSDSFSPTAC